MVFSVLVLIGGEAGLEQGGAVPLRGGALIRSSVSRSELCECDQDRAIVEAD